MHGSNFIHRFIRKLQAKKSRRSWDFVAQTAELIQLVELLRVMRGRLIALSR